MNFEFFPLFKLFLIYTYFSKIVFITRHLLISDIKDEITRAMMGESRYLNLDVMPWAVRSRSTEKTIIV